MTAAKLVYSTWKFTQPGERNGKAIHRNRSAPQPVYLLHTIGEREDVVDGVGVGESGRFVKKLRPADEVAVEITGNTRLFHDAVAPHVARVVVVDTNQFRVISQSVKKTDPNDARLLSLYLSKNLLPEVRMKDKGARAAGESDADARHASEIADRAEEQGEQHSVGTVTQFTEGSAVEREKIERSAGAAL